MTRAASIAAAFLLLGGCGDQCQQLCTQTGTRLKNCKPASLDWADLGAKSQNDFVQQCQDQWDLTSADLTQSDHQIALEVCHDSRDVLSTLTCDEVVGLYVEP
jgi:hypothetical protein